MEYETISRETPEMKQLILGIRNLTKRVRATAQTHRPLFEGELYLTGREVCERLFLSPRTLQDYRDKGIFPYTQIAGKILYSSPISIRYYKRIMSSEVRYNMCYHNLRFIKQSLDFFTQLKALRHLF